MNVGKHLLAHHLDAAGVPDWYGRLYRARRADPANYVAFDREWAAIKREYIQLTGSPEPPEEPLVAKARVVASRAPIPTKMLTYSEVYANKDNER